MMLADPDYARAFTQIRVIAWQYGYAACLHGSGTRDLDVVLVPWTDTARRDVELVVRRIAQVTGTEIQEGMSRKKPHGRLAWSLLLPGNDVRWIDVSVFPPAAEEAQG